MFASSINSSRLDPVSVLGAPPKCPVPIRIDTREQHPLRFAPDYAVTVRACVKVFDYAVDGDEGWAVERKSVSDLIGSFTVNKDAELRKIEKARATFENGWPLVYVVEGGMRDIMTYEWKRFDRVNSAWFFSTLARLVQLQGVTMIFASDRTESALWIYRLLKSRHKFLRGEK